MHLAHLLRRRAWVKGAPLRAEDFRDGTPLRHFFAWNERAWRPARRYLVANDVHRLLTAFGGGAAARELCALHLGGSPVIRARLGDRLFVGRDFADAADRSARLGGSPAVAAGRRLVESLLASIGADDAAAHAAVFAAFEELGAEVDLGALARLRHAAASPGRRTGPRRVLVIRLSALGDFVQSLGPVEAIRRHHRDDRVTLLTTGPFLDFARSLEYFDEILVDRRPAHTDLGGWLALRRTLRTGGFDRVYDLQTSQRSSAYYRLFKLRRPPEWSGIAAGCSHPHANLDRDRQHTIEKQAEQLLMAGIYPTPPPHLPLFASPALPVPEGAVVLIAPGSSPHRPEKRWPAERFGDLARGLDAAGFRPVIVGTGNEAPLAAAIRSRCPAAVDLTGRTGIPALAALAQRAALTIGNDNGVSHLAAAADCPVVVLFSAASEPERCAPRGRLVRILAVPELSALAVEAVTGEARAVLRGRAAAGGEPHPIACTT